MLFARDLSHLRNCQGVITISEFTRSQLLERTPLRDEQVWVVPPYSLLDSDGSLNVPSPPSMQSPWNLTYVAADRPHKNIPGFLNILSRLDSRYRGVLVSHITHRTSCLLNEMNLGKRVTIFNGLDETVGMRKIYASTQILVYPSMFEGFGLPLIDAMSHGIPIVASSNSSIPEVVADSGMLLDPDDLNQWVEAIYKLSDPLAYREYSLKSRVRSQQYTQTRTGRALTHVFRGFTPSECDGKLLVMT